MRLPHKYVLWISQKARNKADRDAALSLRPTYIRLIMFFL